MKDSVEYGLCAIALLAVLFVAVISIIWELKCVIVTGKQIGRAHV